MKKQAGISFSATLLQFAEQGEKTGWTYVEVSAELAQELLPRNKKMFQVKGRLDQHAIAGAWLLPMGGGDFILPVNASMRKGIHKRKGAMVAIKLELDTNKYKLNQELMDCLTEEPEALLFFKSLPPSRQNYFSKWVDAAKTDETKATRIARCIYGLQRKWDYGQMIRFYKGKA
ncbi:MAG: DUF1905 domain-containing protein [Niabella sp.]|nr:DUF1905 domain-containing protein [Niabella sp.]